eukprot:1151419-Amphidinium_carterae.1
MSSAPAEKQLPRDTALSWRCSAPSVATFAKPCKRRQGPDTLHGVNTSYTETHARQLAHTRCVAQHHDVSRIPCAFGHGAGAPYQ